MPSARYGFLMALGLALAGCDLVQTSNTFSGDESLYGDASGTPEFRAARQVFRTECAKCHSVFAAYTEQDWIAEGWVEPGEPDISAVFRRIRGSDTGGDEDMPLTGNISAASIDKIRTWIESL